MIITLGDGLGPEAGLLRFAGGKPRAGKTLYCVQKLVDELRFGSRPCLVFGAIKMEPWVDGKGVARKGLARALWDKYGSEFDCRRRVRLLTLEEAKRFWRIRPHVPKDEFEEVAEHTLLPESDHKFRFDARKEPTIFALIDECHEVFPGAAVAKMPDADRIEMLSYGTQQARAGDDSYLISQMLGNVHNQLRGVAQECHWLINHRLRAVGLFRQPDMLRAETYATVPPAPSEAAMSDSILRVDREFLFSVYDTAGGGTVQGAGADIGKRARGLHLGWLAIPIAALIALLWFVPSLFGYVVGGATGSVKKIGAEIAPVVPSTVHFEAGKVSSVEKLPAAMPAASSEPVPYVLPALFVRVVNFNGQAFILDLDGERHAAEFVHDSGNWALVGGNVWKRTRPPVAAIETPR